MGADWISAIVSVIALVSSGVAFLTARRSALKAESLDKKNVEIAELQSRLAHQNWADDHFRDVAQWASDIAEVISRAIHYLDEDDQNIRRDILAGLSSRIDTGRWYFPNQLEDGFGRDKEPAYQGIRQPLLDWVVLAYDIYAGNQKFVDSRAMLVTCQRSFVSAVQEHIDPRSRDKAVSKVLTDFSTVGSMPRISSPPKSNND